MNLMGIDYSVGISHVPPSRYVHGQVFLNEEISIPIDDPHEATHFMIIGSTGGGKTFLIGIIASQFDNVLFFDGKGGKKFEYICGELGVTDEWEFFNLDTFNNMYDNPLKINVRDMTPDILNVLEIRKDGYLQQARANLERFLGKPVDDPDKTYAEFERILTTEKPVYPNLFRELSVILDPDDDGMSLEDLVSGKKCIDLNGFNTSNRSIGVLAQMALQHKKLAASIEDNEKLLFAGDEMDTIASLFTALNEAFSTVFRQGRSSNISGLACGTAHGKLGTAMIQNSKVFFFFECTKKQTNAVWQDFGVNIQQEDFNSARLVHPKGNCLIQSPNFGITEQRMIYINADFFKKEVKKQEKPDYKMLDWSKYT